MKRGPTERSSFLDSPKMKILQKNNSAKPAVLDNFNQMMYLHRAHGGNHMDSKPSTVNDYTEDVNLLELNEVSNSSESFKDNSYKRDDAVENSVTDVKRIGCNPSYKLYLNTDKVFENGTLEQYTINSQESKESHRIKLSPGGEINIQNTNDISKQITHKSALNLASTGRTSNVNTKCNKGNTSKSDDTGENSITGVKRVGWYPANNLYSNGSEEFENSTSEKSPISNEENKESYGIKLYADGEINLHNTSDILKQLCLLISDLNSASAEGLSNINTACNTYNPSKSDTPGENSITEVKCVGCYPTNKLNSNTNEVFEYSTSEEYPINNQEIKESHGIKQFAKDKINIHNTSKIFRQICLSALALNLASAEKVSKINTSLNKDNPSKNDDAGEYSVTDLKCVGYNPSNKLYSYTKEVLENSTSEKSTINNQENKESHEIKLSPNGEINLHNISNIPKLISYEGALNLSCTGKVLNINTERNIMLSRSSNLGTKYYRKVAKTQNWIKNKLKKINRNKCFNKVDAYEHGDNSISPEGKGKNCEFRDYKIEDNFNESGSCLVNYFENIKTHSPIKTDLKSNEFSSEKRKLSETNKQQKRKLTENQDYQPYYSRKADSNFNSNDDVEFCVRCKQTKIGSEKFKAPRQPRKKSITFAQEDVLPYYSYKVDPHFNFNDDTAEFCAVRCRQSHIGSGKLFKPPRQPREKSKFTLLHKTTIQTYGILSEHEFEPGLQIQAREHSIQQNLSPDESTKTEEENGIDDSLAACERNASTGVIELISLNCKDEYQHEKFNKASIDEQKSQESNLDLKAVNRKIGEPTCKEEKGKSLENEEPNFAKCFSSLFLFMVIFVLGIYNQFFK